MRRADFVTLTSRETEQEAIELAKRFEDVGIPCVLALQDESTTRQQLKGPDENSPSALPQVELQVESGNWEEAQEILVVFEREDEESENLRRSCLASRGVMAILMAWFVSYGLRSVWPSLGMASRLIGLALSICIVFLLTKRIS